VTTKWDHLSETEREALDATPLNIPCSGCGKNLSTEGDFARHFVLLYGRQYLNLGRCPNKDDLIAAWTDNASDAAGCCVRCDRITRNWCAICKRDFCHDCIIDHSHGLDGRVFNDD
jgi:hypothetical protein